MAVQVWRKLVLWYFIKSTEAFSFLFNVLQHCYFLFCSSMASWELYLPIWHVVVLATLCDKIHCGAAYVKSIVLKKGMISFSCLKYSIGGKMSKNSKIPWLKARRQGLDVSQQTLHYYFITSRLVLKLNPSWESEYRNRVREFECWEWLCEWILCVGLYFFVFHWQYEICCLSLLGCQHIVWPCW